jgi:hypothetical protein
VWCSCVTQEVDFIVTQEVLELHLPPVTPDQAADAAPSTPSPPLSSHVVGVEDVARMVRTLYPDFEDMRTLVRAFKASDYKQSDGAMERDQFLTLLKKLRWALHISYHIQSITVRVRACVRACVRALSCVYTAAVHAQSSSRVGF